MAQANENPKVYATKSGVFAITVKGKTPLLVNKILDKDLDQMEAKQQGRKVGGKEPRDPESEWLGHLHKTASGGHGFPAIAFKKAMVRAAKSTDMAMTDARAAFQVIGDGEGMLEIRGSEPTMRRDFGKLQGRTGTVFYRPMFRGWEITLSIEFDPEFTTTEQVLNLLQKAGSYPGVGAWRPECSGPFGTFTIKEDAWARHTL